MNEADKFALVPRPPGALEKAEPGAKRVLTSMVQDTLALAWTTKVQAQNIPALPSHTNQFSDYIEQKSIKARLELATAAAKIKRVDNRPRPAHWFAGFWQSHTRQHSRKCDGVNLANTEWHND